MNRSPATAVAGASRLAALALGLAAPLAAQEVPEGAQGLYPHRLRPIDAIYGHLLEGEFREPTGLYFDREASELFVTNGKRGLVGIFDPLGAPVFTFGGPRLLVDPRAVEVRPDGTIYVLDTDALGVKAFNYRGEPQEPVRFVRPPESGESEDEQAGARRDAPPGSDAFPEYVRIADFTIAPDGSWYVADRDRPQVLVYGPDLELRFAIRPGGRRGPSFSVISGLALGPDDVLAVIDLKATPVQIFDDQGRFLNGFGERDIGLDNFTAPVAAGFDEEGFLYVVDMLRHDVKIFDLEGRLLARFGGWFGPETGGRSPGEMLYPSDIAFGPEGLLYVSERFGQRVQLFRRLPLDGEPEPRQGRLRVPNVPPVGDDDR